MIFFFSKKKKITTKMGQKDSKEKEKGSSRELRPLVKKSEPRNLSDEEKKVIVHKAERMKTRGDFNNDLDYAIYLSRYDDEQKFILLPQEKKYNMRNKICQLSYKEPLIGYKIVRVMKREESGATYLSTDTIALLELRFGGEIRTGIGGKVRKADQLQNGEKYCTNSVTPVSAQLIGRNTETLLFLSVQFEAGKTYFVSNFEEKFEYPLGIELIDPNFGKQGKGCICGIHFFIDKQSAIKYMSTGFTGIDYSDAPRMTFPFEQGDAKIVEC